MRGGGRYRGAGWRLLLVVGATLVPGVAAATGFTDIGYDVLSSTRTRFEIDGTLRLRSALLHNLDLDRGTTPSGEAFFPVSLSEPDRQTLYYTDARLRTDLAFYAPGGIVAVKLRVDVLDNIALGGSADGIPGGTLTQTPPAAAFVIKRAYGEVVTPLGYLAAGRMGHHWGLGMLGNGGDCADCDSGDAADRVVFATTAFDHILAVAYDFSSIGHLEPRKDGLRAVEVEPAAAVRSVALGILRWRTPWGRKRRRLADKTTVEYGAYWAHRWQDKDVPASYLPVAHPVAIGASQVVQRGLKAHAGDLWLRLTHPLFRLELEVAYLWAAVEQASTLPGFELANRVESSQLGAVLESRIGRPEGRVTGGLDLGYASGDAAGGFGARPALQDLTPPRPGDLDGPQAVPPYDNEINNFRFHPDYRVDRILFREIIGTVTDAFYLRPHARVRLLDFERARLDASLVGIVSWAVMANSAPGGERPLGVEIDPTLEYHSDDGFAARLEYAVLVPLAGLDNPVAGLGAKPAQLLRLHLAYGW